MPDASERITNLRSIPLFSDLPDEALQSVLDCATEFEAERGHVLIQRDHPGTGLFVIEEGTCLVELRDRKIELGPGEFVGELALLDETITHIARVAAATHVRCLAIRRDDFDNLLRSQPQLAVTMLKVLARRLANMNLAGEQASSD